MEANLAICSVTDHALAGESMNNYLPFLKPDSSITSLTKFRIHRTAADRIPPLGRFRYVQEPILHNGKVSIVPNLDFVY